MKVIEQAKHYPELKLLVEEMGGHGRALEVLADVLKRSKPDDGIYWLNPIHEAVVEQMRNTYSAWSVENLDV